MQDPARVPEDHPVIDQDVRRSWLEWRADDLSLAAANKQPQIALDTGAVRYRRLSEQDQAVVDELLAEQLSSASDNDRFLALTLIEDFEIVSALPALRRLASSLEFDTGPGAPYEWAQVNRVIAKLATKSD